MVTVANAKEDIVGGKWGTRKRVLDRSNRNSGEDLDAAGAIQLPHHRVQADAGCIVFALEDIIENPPGRRANLKRFLSLIKAEKHCLGLQTMYRFDH